MMNKTSNTLDIVAPNSWTITLLITSVFALLISIICPPIQYLPATYEHHILWECLSIGGSTSINCVQVQTPYFSPLLPILSGFLSLILPDTIAIGILYFAFQLWTIAILWKFSSQFHGYWNGICTLFLFLFVGFQSDILHTATPEIAITPIILTVLFVFVLQEHHSSQWKAFRWGLFLGFGYLISATIFLYGLGICAVAYVKQNRIWKTFSVAYLCIPILWQLFLSIYTGQLILHPTILQNIDHLSDIPIPLVFWEQMVGEGIYHTSMRSILIPEYIPLIQNSLFLPDLDVLHIHLQKLVDRIPAFLLCSICTLCYQIKKAFEKTAPNMQQSLHQKYLFIGVIVLILITMTSQRDFFIFIPFIALYCVSIAIVLCSSLRYPSFDQPKSIAIMVAIGLLLYFGSSTGNPKPVENSDAGRFMMDWISKHTNPQSTIQTTKINTPLLFLTNRRWKQYTSPFDLDKNNESQYILVSKHDVWSTSQDLGNLVAYTADKDMWFGLYTTKGMP